MGCNGREGSLGTTTLIRWYLPQGRCRVSIDSLDLLILPLLTANYYSMIMSPDTRVYRVTRKIGPILYALTLPNINDFQNYFTVRVRRKFVIILSLKITPHLKCVATLLCEMSNVLKATIENKTSSVTTHF